MNSTTRRVGNGRVRLAPADCEPVCAALDNAAAGGVGTKPECVVNSTDKILTSLSRIQIEIKDEGKVSVLKFLVWRGPCGRCHHGQALLSGELGRPRGAKRRKEKRGKRRGYP
jgi:hypothetical protein